MASIAGFFSGIGDWFKSLYLNLVELFNAIDALEASFAEAERQWQEIKTQQFAAPSSWKTRVIQPLAVVEKLNGFRTEIIDDFDAAFAKARAGFDQIKLRVQQQQQLKLDPGAKPNAIFNVIGWIATIILVINLLQQALQQFLQLTSVVVDLKNQIETLDVLFLTQAKPRTYESKTVYTRKP